jgi:ribonuclease BN (tRNA processing enzyme)
MTIEVNGHRLLLLGTGAGDWPKSVPPEEVTYTGNRDYRRFSAAAVNDSLLIDCGPTLLNSLDIFSVDARKLSDLLITHTHWDHVDLDALRGLLALRDGLPPLRMWGHASALRHLPALEGLEVQYVEVQTPFLVDGWTVEALRANHWVAETAEQAVIYLFTRGDLQWLYSTDTAWFPTPTAWRLLETKLSLIVLDATYGDSLESPAQYGHNTLEMIRLILKSWRQDNVLKPDASIVLTHLSKGWHPPHAELAQRLERDGLTPGFDGMRLELCE